MTPRTLTITEWREEAAARFGTEQAGWRFVCPCCGHIASIQDWKDAGAPEGAIAFSCVGRWAGAKRAAIEGTGPGPCNYAGGGLFNLNPVTVLQGEGKHRVFEFAEVITMKPGELRTEGDTIDFANLGEAERWLTAHGYVFGSMQRDAPIGVQLASRFDSVAKWRLLTPAERKACVAVLQVGVKPGEPIPLQVADRPWRLTWQRMVIEGVTSAPEVA